MWSPTIAKSLYSGTSLQKTLHIKDTSLMRMMSAVSTTLSCAQIYRTTSWVPMVSPIERFHCIQHSQLGPNGVLYSQAPLYIT